MTENVTAVFVLCVTGFIPCRKKHQPVTTIYMTEKVMNEKAYRILFYVSLGVALLFAGAGVFVSVRYASAERELGRTGAELERIRTELSNAADQQRELTESLAECAELCSDTERILSMAVNTVAGLREQLHAIRKNYEAMEACLRNYRGGDSPYNSDTGNSGVTAE